MILTIDSSTNIASVSLTHDGEFLYYAVLDDGKTHSQKLMLMIDECFKKSGHTPQDMDAFAAVAGPGSFTGLRIGLAAVQGMAYPLNKPCISISTLDAMAFGAGEFSGLIVPLIDARNTQAYSAVYNAENSFKKIISDGAGPVKDIAKEVAKYKHNALFIGDGALKNHDIIAEVLGENALFFEKEENYTAAKGAAYLAQKYFNEKKLITPRELIPYYFRNTSAKKKFT